MLRRTLLATAAALPFAPARAQAPADRAAQVTSNFAYPGALLGHVRQDGIAVAEQLKRNGFQVEELRNTQKRPSLRQLTDFIRGLKPGGVALYHFAGHAMQYKGRNHLLPIDAQLLRESDVIAEGLELDIIVERLADAPSAAKLVIIDACRTSPYAIRLRTPLPGLAPIQPAKDMLIAYAAEPGTTSFDDPTGGSIFAAALTEALARPGATADEVFAQVRAKVLTETQGNQKIWLASTLTQPLVLGPAKG